jgi:hypothetical protein
VHQAFFSTTPYTPQQNEFNSFRVFRCVAHVKRVGPGINKLSDRSIPMVFIVYEEGTKGYMLYDPVAKRLHVSRDVIFEEN